MKDRFMHSRNVYGFTLVELSIVLVIAGLLVVPLLKGFEIWKERQGIKTTKQNIEEINLALSRYVNSPIDPLNPAILRERLPCPANASLPDTDPNHGAALDCNSVTAGPGIAIVPGSRPGTEVVIGAVPFRDLSLSADLASDAWGGRLTYAVTRNLATTPAPAGGFDENMGAIRLINQTGGDAIESGFGLYAVVSHGKSGAGGYSKSGGVLRGACPAGTLESENCDFANATFRTMDISESAGAAYFDDYAAAQRNLVLPSIAVPNCAIGQYVSSVGGVLNCVDLPTTPTCGTGQYLTNTSGGMTCVDLPTPTPPAVPAGSCPPGQYVTAMSGGTVTCSTGPLEVGLSYHTNTCTAGSGVYVSSGTYGDFYTCVVYCPAGKKAIAGSCWVDSGQPPSSSAIWSGDQGWECSSALFAGMPQTSTTVGVTCAYIQ